MKRKRTGDDICRQAGATMSHPKMNGAFQTSIYRLDKDPLAQGQNVRTLFLAVIERSLLDFRWGWIIYTHGGSTPHSLRRYRKLIRHLEIQYFYSQDFEEICSFAGVDARDVRTSNFMPAEKPNVFTPRDIANIRRASQEYSRRLACAER